MKTISTIIGKKKIQKNLAFFVEVFIETVVFLLIVLALVFLFDSNAFRLNSIVPHPFWGIVLIISIRYGLKESLISSVMVSFVYVGIYLSQSDSTYTYSSITFFDEFRLPILFILVGGIISESHERAASLVVFLKKKIKRLSNILTSLQEENGKYLVTVGELEKRISGQYSSLLDIFSEIAEAKKLSLEDLQKFFLMLINKYVYAYSMDYFDVSKSRLRLKYSFKKENKKAWPLKATNSHLKI